MIPPDRLLEQIRLGEDSGLECKRLETAGAKVVAPSSDRMADELAAFANGRGGTLVLGVDDDSGEVVGIPRMSLDAVEQWVREVCNDSIEPPLDAGIWKRQLSIGEGQATVVMQIDVPRSLFVHRSPGGYCQRIGSSKRQMRPEVLARLFAERSQSRLIRFDESVVPGTALSDIDTALARRLLGDGAEADETALRKLGIVSDDDTGTARLTLAGVLMSAQRPQAWLPHAQIQAVYYAAERPSAQYQLDARDIDGPLDRQVADGLHFLRRNMFVSAHKRLGRVDRPQYSERAVFEALVNAVAHRDYSMAGARIRFHMFTDRIELSVPGALANTLTPDVLALRQYSRNELIVSLLARCSAAALDPEGLLGRQRVMDRRGDGVPIILHHSNELSGRRPAYELIGENELRLTIWAAEPPTPSPEAEPAQ